MADSQNPFDLPEVIEYVAGFLSLGDLKNFRRTSRRFLEATQLCFDRREKSEINCHVPQVASAVTELVKATGRFPFGRVCFVEPDFDNTLVSFLETCAPRIKDLRLKAGSRADLRLPSLEAFQFPSLQTLEIRFTGDSVLPICGKICESAPSLRRASFKGFPDQALIDFANYCLQSLPNKNQLKQLCIHHWWKLQRGPEGFQKLVELMRGMKLEEFHLVAQGDRDLLASFLQTQALTLKKLTVPPDEDISQMKMPKLYFVWSMQADLGLFCEAAKRDLLPNLSSAYVLPYAGSVEYKSSLVTATGSLPKVRTLELRHSSNFDEMNGLLEKLGRLFPNVNALKFHPTSDPGHPIHDDDEADLILWDNLADHFRNLTNLRLFDGGWKKWDEYFTGLEQGECREVQKNLLEVSWEQLLAQEQGLGGTIASLQNLQCFSLTPDSSIDGRERAVDEMVPGLSDASFYLAFFRMPNLVDLDFTGRRVNLTNACLEEVRGRYRNTAWAVHEGLWHTVWIPGVGAIEFRNHY